MLEKELARKRIKGVVGTGSMSDPYTPAEARYRLTGRALELIAHHGFGVHITTKSDLIVRDLDVLREISRVRASASFTVTTADDDLARKVEPYAPLPSARFAAMAQLAAAGIVTGVTLMPVLPFIEDNAENLARIVQRAAASGARYIVPWFGMSLRDRQRAYYYEQLDRLFPGLRAQYERRFGERYSCAANDARNLEPLLNGLCHEHGIVTDMRLLAPSPVGTQMRLF